LTTAKEQGTRHSPFKAKDKLPRWAVFSAPARGVLAHDAERLAVKALRLAESRGQRVTVDAFLPKSGYSVSVGMLFVKPNQAVGAAKNW